jgi:hypothetical protein
LRVEIECRFSHCWRRCLQNSAEQILLFNFEALIIS